MLFPIHAEGLGMRSKSTESCSPVEMGAGMEVEQITIIGAGPAGLAAALQLKRSGLTPLVLERDCIGGLLRNANLVENYLGFPAGISGSELVRLMREQAAFASVEVIHDEVVALSCTSGLFQVQTRQSFHCSKTVIIASGTKPITFPDNLVPEDALDRIYYEVDPLRAISGKRIVVVGAGDAAFDYALNLAKRNHVTILNRAEKVKCLPLLWERAVAHPHITYLPCTSISNIERISDDTLVLECLTPKTNLQLHAHYLIGALGREPQLDFVSGDLRDQFGALQISGCLHIIGDVKNGAFRQAAIAVGEGILTGMKIYHQFKESE